MQQRGFGDLVVSVFIFLLALLFVGVFGAYLFDVLNQGSAGLRGSGACTLMQISPTSCVYMRTQEGFDLNVSATYQGSTVDVQELYVLLTNAATHEVIRKSAAHIPHFLETGNVYSLSNLSSQRYSHVALASTIVLDGGVESVTCAPSKMIECV